MTGTIRLFFGLPCPLEAGERLIAWREAQRLPGRAVWPGNLHLTLAFLGSQPAECLPVLRALADGLDAEPFHLRLDRLQLMQKGLVWIEPTAPPAALLTLAADLQQALGEAGFPVDTRPYRPHVTLVRHHGALPADPPPAFDWLAERFALYASEGSPEGVRYRPLASWPLRRRP